MSTDQSIVRYVVVTENPAYRVGTDGSVWSRRIRSGAKNAVGDEWRKLSPAPRSEDGYCRVELVGTGSRYVHHLVLRAFVGPCPDGMECCHRDGNRSNNCLTNLRWGTHKSNHDDAVSHGTWTRGEISGASKLNDDKVRDIRRRCDGSICTYVTLAVEYGVHWKTIRAVVKRKTWKHVV